VFHLFYTWTPPQDGTRLVTQLIPERYLTFVIHGWNPTHAAPLLNVGHSPHNLCMDVSIKQAWELVSGREERRSNIATSSDISCAWATSPRRNSLLRNMTLLEGGLRGFRLPCSDTPVLHSFADVPSTCRTGPVLLDASLPRCLPPPLSWALLLPLFANYPYRYTHIPRIPPVTVVLRVNRATR